MRTLLYSRARAWSGPSTGRGALPAVASSPARAQVRSILAGRAKGPDVDAGTKPKKESPPPKKADDTKPDKTDKVDRKEDSGLCKGSPIHIEVRKPATFPNSFSKTPSDALLDSSGCEIFVPDKTKSVSQHEELSGTLRWKCPGKDKSGSTSAKHTIDWTTPDDQLTRTDHGKFATDGHAYGLCCDPGRMAREAAEKKGFDLTKCEWSYEEKFTADTTAAGASKTIHRCQWGFNWKQEVGSGGTAKGTTSASVDYFGVDSVEVV